MLNAPDLALARRRTYDLFGRLFLSGLDAELLPRLESVPELAEAARPFDADEAAAEHYQVTAVAVFPYESIFRDPSGLLGGLVSEQVGAAYRQYGFHVASDADHLGRELAYMAHLCAAEGQAHAVGDARAATLWHGRQQAFLAAHLLAWLPPLVAAIDASGSRFYGRLAQLALALCADHLRQVPLPQPPLTLPDAPPLAGEETGLKEIARYLATPPFCGLFLSREAITALARRHALPRGFGERAQLLTNLLRSAGRYDAARAVLQDLAALFTGAQDRYRQQENAYPNAGPWIFAWRERAGQTAGSLVDLTDAIAEAESEDAPDGR